MLVELKVRCRQCSADYCLSDMPADKSGRFGVSPRCRACRNGRVTKWREELKAAGLPPAAEKKCSDCLLVKSQAEFHRNANAKDGLYRHCKQCAEKRRTLVRRPPPAFSLKIPDKKRCSQCKQVLASSRFSVDSKRRDGLNTYCRNCLSVRHSARKYSLSIDEATALRATASCECCGDAMAGREVCIDHCHTTGRVRGALCAKCNFMLGAARDRPEILRSGAAYLERTSRRNASA